MNEILKKSLKHYVNLEQYANGVAYEIEEKLNELYKECNEAVTRREYLKTKAEYNIVHQEMEEYLEEFEEELEDTLQNEAETVKNNECNFLSKVYGAALAVGTIALSKILFMPFDGRDTVKSFAERTVKNISRSYDNALRSGYMFGKKSSEVKEQAEQQLKQVTRGIKNGVVTAIPSFAKTTDRIIFLQNNIEVTYVATLDGRTCISCASMSGLKFKNVALAPSVPQHALCRCILIPGSEITEPVPEFEEFIESLSEEEQKEVLGANRYELWKEYGIKLDKFLNDGRVVPLKDLELPENLKIISTGARSKIINILNGDDIVKNERVAFDYYSKIRESSDNRSFIKKIAENSGKDFREVEQIVNHVFTQKHRFEGGRIDYFDPSTEVVKAFERLRTNEHTDSDILLLNHEFEELTYMKNKKYNTYEVAHEMANKKYNWQEVINNENVSKN